MKSYLETLFDPNEFIFIGESKYDTHGIYRDQIYTWNELQFVSINPGLPESSRSDLNVAKFRNFLVELDHGTKAEQRRYLDQRGVPYSVLVDSAGKSLHAVICLEGSLPDEATWREYAEGILACVPKADPNNKNPSRFTRIGGGTRDDKEQKIIEVRPRCTKEALDLWLKSEPAYWKYLASKQEKTEEYAKMDAANPDRLKLTNTTLAFLSEEALPGSRNKALFVSARDFLENGIDYDTATNELLPLALRHGLSQREALITLKSAYRKKNA